MIDNMLNIKVTHNAYKNDVNEKKTSKVEVYVSYDMIPDEDKKNDYNALRDYSEKVLAYLLHNDAENRIVFTIGDRLAQEKLKAEGEALAKKLDEEDNKDPEKEKEEA